MQFNEYKPQGGWLKFYARQRRNQALANILGPLAVFLGLPVAYWLAAILELGL